MAARKIIEIDREKCDGCGLCTTACAEGALTLDGENKAILLNEIYCDGLGACLDVCPRGALKVVERESEAYKAQVAYNHVLKTRGAEAARQVHGISDSGLGSSAPGAPGGPHFPKGCPGSRAQEITRPEASAFRPGTDRLVSGDSELSQWPVQLHLVSSQAPYFNGSDLLLAADCTAFASGSFHQDFLKDKKLIIACPKLDDPTGYVEKLAEILKRNTVYSLTVLIMSVPCCSGLYRMAEAAAALSGKRLSIKRIVIGLDGKVIQSPAA